MRPQADTLSRTATKTARREAAGETVVPVTPMQLGLIYESTMAGQPWINLEQIVVRMTDEPVDPAAMREAWADLARRHAILRTTFAWEGRDQPVQLRQAEAAVTLHERDLTDRDPEEQDDMIAAFLNADREQGVDLTEGPTWRLTWFRLAPRQSVLVWTFHHALLDGRSFPGLLAEALDHYRALTDGRGKPEFKPRADFEDHCRAIAKQDLSRAERHFRADLSGFDAPNRIDFGPAPLAGQTGRKRLVDRVMAASFGRELRALAEAKDLSVATLVAAAWGLVVARCSNRADAVFGLTRAGRNHVAGAETMAGCVINTLPLRIGMSPDLTIDELMQATRASMLAQRDYEQVPLTEIARWSEVPRDEPLFESALLFERGTLGARMAARGGDWVSREVTLHEEGALPLTLAVYDDPEMLFRLEYDPARFGRAEASRLMGYLLALLDGFVTQPGSTPLAALQMISPYEQADLLRLSRADGEAPARIACVVSAFEAQAARRRGVSALRVAGAPDQLSYAELDRRANQLAHLLKRDGVGQGDLVAIALPRSLDYVVAMLAIMKSGAAFLPVDPSYPAATIDHMLRDSGAMVLISDSASLPMSASANAVLMDQPGLFDGLPSSPPRRGALAPERAAYVIYTSGSTGTPKGVVVPRRALAAHAAAAAQAFGLSRSDKVLQFASLSFDVSLEEIVPTLLSGGQLILRSQEMAESIPEFLARVAEFGMTVLNLPTAFWHTLVDHMDATGDRLPASVRLVIAGGEAVSRQALDRFRAMQPGLAWMNGYGPTETTITATLFDGQVPLAEGEDVPIGRPLHHVRAHVLAPDGSLAPRGAAGELCLGGPGVAKGYLLREEMTAERFIPDLHSGDTRDGARLYRSGDVARWREDGNLAFGGRTDRQVKVNGYRIELRQVERALEAKDEVGLALAAVEGKGTPRARLVAWVTPAPEIDVPPAADELQQAVSEDLPPQMVPAIVLVDGFPKTAGGKVDIAALPSPAAPETGDTADSGDETTERVRAIYADLLGHDHIGADQSFYDLGGHSLLAVRLIGRVEMEWGRRLSVAELRRAPSPRQLARVLNGTQNAPAHPERETDAATVVPIQPGGACIPIYGVHVLGQNEEFFRPLANALGGDQPLFGLTVDLAAPNLPIGVEETAAAYAAALARHQPRGPVVLAAVSQGSFIAFELAHQLRAAGREVAMLMLFDAAGPAGRASLTGWARWAMHGRLLRAQGLPYLRVVVGNRLESLRNKIEKFRLKRRGAEVLEAPTVDAFVAANTLAIEAYEARPYDGPITLFRAEESHFDTEAARREALGWRAVAGGPLEMIDVPGGHLSMLAPPHVDRLAQVLAAVLSAGEQASAAE